MDAHFFSNQALVYVLLSAKNGSRNIAVHNKLSIGIRRLESNWKMVKQDK